MARSAQEHVIGERSVTFAAVARGRFAREALLPWFFVGVFVLSVPLGVGLRSPELVVAGAVLGAGGVALFSSPFGVRPLYQRLLDVVRWRSLARSGELRYAPAAGFAGLEGGRHAPGRPPAAFGTITWRDVPYRGPRSARDVHDHGLRGEGQGEGADGAVCVWFQDGHYGVTVQVDAAWGGLPDVLRHDRLRGELSRALGQLSDSFDRVAMYSVCSYTDVSGLAPPSPAAPAAFRDACEASRDDAAAHPTYDHFLTLWATAGPPLRAAARAARARGDSDPHLAAAHVVASRLERAVPLLAASSVRVRRPLDAQRLAGVTRGLLDRSLSLWDDTPTDPSRMFPSMEVHPTHVGVHGRHGDGFLRGFEVAGFSDAVQRSDGLLPLHSLGAAVRGRTVEHVVAVVVDVRGRVATLAEAHRHDQGVELRRQVRESTSHLRPALERPADERQLNVSAAGGGWHGGYGAVFFVVNAASAEELDDDGEALVAAARGCGVHLVPVAALRQDQAVVAGTPFGWGLARVL